MTSISLMDIIYTEASLGEKIFSDNKAYTIVCINNTCLAFNKITRDVIEKRREEYYCEHIPKKIEEAMKMFTYSELGITTKKYMKLIPIKYRNNYMNFSNMDREHYLSIYESTIDALGEKINNSIYHENILRQMIKQFKHYIILSNNNNYIWYGLYGNLYKKMMIEHYVFIISIMNYVLKKKDFEGEEHIIAMLQNLFTEELIEIIE
jgi:hypothetical protein